MVLLIVMSFLDKVKSIIAKTPLGAIESRFSGGQSVLGIDIGSASIKVVQLRRDGGKAILETYGTITLGPYKEVEAGRVVKLQPAKLAEALSDLIRESNVTTSNASVAIPFASSLTSIIEMPKMSKDQLNKMVPLEARKYIPVPTSEVTMDWFVIPEDDAPARGDIKNVLSTKKKYGDNKMFEVLLVAIHNNILNDYQAVMSTADLSIQFYELEVFSAARGSLGHGVAPVVIVDIGASSTKIYIVERGIIRMSHMVNKGSQDLTLYIERSMGISFKKAERLKRERGLNDTQPVVMNDGSKVLVRDAMLSTLDHIFAEINRVVLTYGKKYHKNISKVVFSGGSTAMVGFTEYANSKIDNEVELADPFNKIQTPAFLEDVLGEVGPEFAVATGLALRQLHGGN